MLRKRFHYDEDNAYGIQTVEIRIAPCRKLSCMQHNVSTSVFIVYRVRYRLKRWYILNYFQNQQEVFQ